MIKDCPKCNHKAVLIHTDSDSGFEYWHCKSRTCAWRSTDDLFASMPVAKKTKKMRAAEQRALGKINKVTRRKR